MRVVSAKLLVRPFGQLLLGEVFSYCGAHYIKTMPVQAAGYPGNALTLESNIFANFSDQTCVVVKNAVVNVSD